MAPTMGLRDGALGVYCVKNSVNGKVFLGSGVDIQGTLNGHEAKLKFPSSHPIAELQRDWNQFGPDAFSFEILELLEPKEGPSYDYSEELEKLEKNWRAKLDLDPELEY